VAAAGRDSTSVLKLFSPSASEVLKKLITAIKASKKTLCRKIFAKFKP
jgi:hypothetical protein